jgi:spore germination protein KB
MTNNRKENISLWQLFILIINFELGSAMVVSLGNEAKQDAWLAILLATVYGVGLVWAYTFLLNREPGKTLYEIIEKAGEKIFSNILTVMYVLYFFYLSARVLRDFGELITSVILPNRPLEISAWTFMILIVYILYLGLENLGRLNELFTPYLILFIFAITVLLIISGEFTFNNIQLPFKDGVTPVVKAIFPQLMGFPFAGKVSMAMGMLVAIFSVITSKNFSELMKEGNKILPALLDLPFQIGIPAVILGLVCWKQRKVDHLQGEG